MNVWTRIPLAAVIACSLTTVQQAIASSPRHSPRPVTLASIHMIMPTTGWGVTRTAVVHTMDGGRHWQSVTPALPPSGFAAGVALDPISSESAWLASPSARNQVGPIAISIFDTANAGKSWRRLATIRIGLFLGIQDLQFVDRLHGWLIVTRDVGMSQQSFEIWRTSDGGGHWSRIVHEGQLYGNGGQASGLPSCDCMQAYRFVSATTGWAGACSCALSPGLDQLYRSTDGGRTWHPYPLRLPPGAHPDAVAVGAPVFSGARAGVLPVVLLKSSSGGSFVLYHTADAGRTWRASTPIAVQLDDDPAAFPDARHALVQDGQMMYHTADTGRTWHATRSALPRDNLMQLDFVSPVIGFAVVGIGSTDKTRLLRTGDGGITWVELQPTSL